MTDPDEVIRAAEEVIPSRKATRQYLQEKRSRP